MLQESCSSRCADLHYYGKTDQYISVNNILGIKFCLAVKPTSSVHAAVLTVQLLRQDKAGSVSVTGLT